MALALPALEAQRDALIKARSNGLRSVREPSGEEVQFRSDAELAAALASVERRIAEFGRSLPSTITFATSKGL